MSKLYLHSSLIRGRDNNPSNDPTSCLLNKSSIRPLLKESNVCSVHGVQTIRRLYDQESEEGCGQTVVGATSTQAYCVDEKSTTSKGTSIHSTNANKSHVEKLKEKIESLKMIDVKPVNQMPPVINGKTFFFNIVKISKEILLLNVVRKIMLKIRCLQTLEGHRR